jgi:hypothetical protein
MPLYSNRTTVQSYQMQPNTQPQHSQVERAETQNAKQLGYCQMVLLSEANTQVHTITDHHQRSYGNQHRG